jgi:hypothetical protein
MKIFSVPKPGSITGPCETLCSHETCRAMRVASKRTCRLCHQAIGYEKKYRYNGTSVTHTACGAKHYKNLAALAAKKQDSAGY